uniref:Caspase 8 associated protein 2 n=1 Tax=Neogobius melanostomus TaxID=47308 RepID=A0A8C6SBH8_9GOBI
KESKDLSQRFVFVPEGNEDSVDIYEDLDFGSSKKSAPARLKEAMDLFEEIVTEEQQSKEASYTELKSRFQAAQSQITDLHRRLEHLQLQNTGLSKENCRLKMNISILLQTARQEVTRKDAPLPPAPASPPPPAPPLPKSPLREDMPVPFRKETEKCTGPGSRSLEQPLSDGLTRRSSREGCHTSERLEKHRLHADKHKDKKYKHDFGRSDTATLKPTSDRHERRHLHKDRTSNLADEKNSKLSKSESDRDKGHVSKESRSRNDRRDGTRDRRSRSSDSKEHKLHRDSSRPEPRLSKDHPSKEGRQEQRAEEDVKRHRRGSKEKHRSKEHSKKSSKPSERSSKGKTISVKVVAEENSPHRKLCFMETLNLTLSPVKKPGVDSEGGLKEPDAAAQTPQDSLQPNMEDMCVLDEVDSSEPEAASVDCPEADGEAPKLKTPDKIKDVEETGICATCDIERLPDNSVHSTSTSKAEIQKEDSLPKCVSERTENREETSTKTSTSEDIFSANQTEASESINSSNTSISTISASENAITISEESKPEVPPKNTLLESPTSTQSKDISSQEVAPKEVETVSSSISLESLPQEGLSLTEAIDLLTQNNEDCSSTASPEPSSTACIEVSKVSSTTQETTSDGYTDLSKTPKKSFGSAKFLSPPKSSEKGMKPSSSVPLLHDEDSMMRTLSSLKSIPDAISPLRSPVRISRRNLQYLQKPGHVKSLQKADLSIKKFSSAPTDVLYKKVDVNKENEHPGSPAKDEPVDMDLAVPLDTELEEGEILSESDEAASPHPPTKRTKLKRPFRAKASPKCVITRKTEEKSDLEASKSAEIIPSPPNKSRFKTVCPAATKASFSSIEDIMDTFKLVRYEIRKKYMKLHKTFPKKSFFGVMENFQESFIEFVDGADFGQICNCTTELKFKLKKIIMSVFSKVLNNGIVKRIFEQQAVDLKQKLWDFVDVQVDYLFKDVNTALKNMCKPTKSPVKQGNTREKDKRHKPSPLKRKEARSPRRLRGSATCAITPFRTGLGSRGKGIRITLDKSDDTDEQSGPEPSTVVSIVSSTPEKVNSSLVVATNTSTLDKTDFELLTEQQATSLTFNLVRDSQMGEIFKCLLQGSDLLDSNAVPGDQNAWALSTPRKDGERIITITTPGKFHTPSKLLTPDKFDSPSRLITTWSSISPRKVPSPSSKILLNPALFDESCLLEVPSDNKITQRPYSILAEDLAVSLTIPSPLKSDSHLSFLQPPCVQVLSTPESVLSAHISEDALLDEADATEHDIHLTLDTDNSSCCSSGSVDSSHGTSTQFLFKPSLPMHALVMERSNDHFILKIRQASSANSTLTADESLSRTSEVPLNRTSSSDREEIASESERSLTIVEELESTPEKPQARKHKDRKRRKGQEKSRAKRRKADEDSNQETSCEATGEEPLSPNSLSAKNVIRKKGKEEDRAILIELKTKGASRDTFSSLSEKLDKPSAQIAQRFHLLMKLFKKMDT